MLRPSHGGGTEYLGVLARLFSRLVLSAQMPAIELAQEDYESAWQVYRSLARDQFVGNTAEMVEVAIRDFPGLKKRRKNYIQIGILARGYETEHPNGSPASIRKECEKRLGLSPDIVHGALTHPAYLAWRGRDCNESGDPRARDSSRDIRTQETQHSDSSAGNGSTNVSMSRYLPRAYFAESDAPQEAFNSAISGELARAERSTFWFRGVSAKYLPVRLFKSPINSERSVRVLFLDPQNAHMMSLRAQRRSHTGNLEAVVREMKMEIWTAVVDLHDARLRCSGIELAVDPHPTVVYRVELVDPGDLFLAEYGPHREKHAPIHQFGSATFTYRVIKSDIERTWDVVAKSPEKNPQISIRAATTDEEIENFLRRIGLPESMSLEALRERSGEVREPLGNDLRTQHVVGSSET